MMETVLLFVWYYFLVSSRYFFASFRKLNVIRTITAAIGNAAIILTDCRLLIELSENTSAIGSAIRRTHHISSINL